MAKAVITAKCYFHKIDVGLDDICPKCQESFDEQVDYYKKNKVVVSMGSPASPKDYYVNGKPRRYSHDSDYIEMDIPEQIIPRVEAFIEQEIKQFEKHCDCIRCLEKGETK